MTFSERHIRDTLRLFLITIIVVLASINSLWAEPVDELKIPISTVAVIHCAYSPVSFWNKTTSVPSGFFVDIMDSVAARAGLDVSYICRDSWDETIAEIESGKADLGVLLKSKDREKKLLFSTPIDTTYLSYFARSQSDLDPASVPSDHIVGVIKGSMSYEKLKDREGVRLLIYDGYRECLFGLLAGDISLMAGEESMILRQLRETSLEDHIKKVGKPFFEVQRCMVVRKDNVQLLKLMNKTLKDFVSGPEYQRIYLKWYGAPAPYWTNSRVVTVSSVLLVVAISGLAFWRYVSISKINTELIRTMSDRNRTELALRESEEKFRTLFESTIDALFIIDMDGNFIDVNKTAYERLGYTKAEMLSMKISQLDHPDFADKIPERMDHMQKHGRCVCESAHVRKDGAAMPVEINACLMEFQGKKVFFSVIRDISERKRMEEALRESEKRYHTLFEQSPYGILLIDTVGKIVEFNEMAHRQLGYSREEFEKLSLSDIDPVESPKEIQDRMNRLVTEGSVEFDVKHRTKQGETRDVQIISQPIDLSGKTFFHAIWLDITERKRMEHTLQESKEKFESLAEGSPLGIALIDMNGNILYINTKIEEFFGYTLGNTPNLKTWWDKAYPDETEREQIIAHWQNTVLRIQRGEKNSPLVRKVVCDDYTVKDIEIRVSRLGENILAVFDDVTERMQMEEHLKKNIMERETLLRELYHRTKNNMNTISSLINLQTASLPSDEIAIQMLRDLQYRIMSMALVHERLYKSKDLSNVNFKDYVSDLANTLITGYKINRDKLSLRLDIEDFTLSIDTLIPCGLIINELMTNSMKYAFVDGRDGQISIKGQVSAESEVQFVYRDNGIGFPGGFDFTKVETLGLRLINGLITAQLRGKIDITTRPETTFTFAFREPGYQPRM